MSNTITIELCAEDRARLDKILEALMTRPNCTACAQRVVDYVTSVTGLTEYGQKVDNKEHATPPEETEPPVTFVEIPEPYADPNPFETPAAAPDPEPVKQTATLADVRQKVVELSAKGKKAQVRDIVKAYADNVTNLPEDKLDEIMAKLVGLEG